MEPVLYGMMNVRNEGEWIKEAIHALLQICDLVFVLDDDSTDDTLTVCKSFGPRVLTWSKKDPSNDMDRAVRDRYPYSDFAADKNFLYDRILHLLPSALINQVSPYWVVAMDGDEVLESPLDLREEVQLRTTEHGATHHSLSLQIKYLWDSGRQIRVDGCYSEMWRPSAFHVFNPAFRFEGTPFPFNLHQPNVPNELVGNHVRVLNCGVKHYGYRDRTTRLAKYARYLALDRNADGEDYYRHMVIGDLPSLPATAKTRYAGPLRLIPYGHTVEPT